MFLEEMSDKTLPRIEAEVLVCGPLIDGFPLFVEALFFFFFFFIC